MEKKLWSTITALILLAVLTASVSAEPSSEPTKLLAEAETTIGNLIMEVQQEDQQLSKTRAKHSEELKSIETAIKAERAEWTTEINRQKAEIEKLKFRNDVYYAAGCILLGGVVGLTCNIAF